MSKTLERLIECELQQCREYERIAKNRNRKFTIEQIREDRFWILAGIHQSALFVLSLDEYYKFKEQAEKIEREYKLAKNEKRNQVNEYQMTLF